MVVVRVGVVIGLVGDARCNQLPPIGGRIGAGGQQHNVVLRAHADIAPIDSQLPQMVDVGHLVVAHINARRIERGVIGIRMQKRENLQPMVGIVDHQVAVLMAVKPRLVVELGQIPKHGVAVHVVAKDDAVEVAEIAGVAIV